MTEVLEVTYLTLGATIPTRGSEYAAGLDLYACLKNLIVIKPGQRAIIPTGIAVWPPENTYVQIAPRSGLAVRHGIDVLAGIVDEDYRGEVKVVLINHGYFDFVVNHGDRIAQAIVKPYIRPTVTLSSKLPTSDRGESGFGSTGV